MTLLKQLIETMGDDFDCLAPILLRGCMLEGKVGISSPAKATAAALEMLAKTPVRGMLLVWFAEYRHLDACRKDLHWRLNEFVATKLPNTLRMSDQTDIYFLSSGETRRMGIRGVNPDSLLVVTR